MEADEASQTEGKGRPPPHLKQGCTRTQFGNPSGLFSVLIFKSWLQISQRRGSGSPASAETARIFHVNTQQTSKQAKMEKHGRVRRDQDAAVYSLNRRL